MTERFATRSFLRPLFRAVVCRAVPAALIASCLVSPAVVRAEPQKQKAGADDVVVDPATERLIDGGLRYLASRQKPNGSWAEGDSHSAAITAYVLLAFMTTGHLPDQGPYGQTVRRGLDFLLNCVRPDGYIAAADGKSNMYGHGIAAIALGEMYGMTADDSIRPRLERAIKLIVDSQNQEGGWRYDPRPSSADVSVTVLQVVALRVAKNSGIKVPDETIGRAIAYVKKCSHPSGGFTYQAKGGAPGVARTAAAVYSLQCLGLYDDPLVAKGSKYIVENVDGDRAYFTYGANYATPAHYMIGGDTWRSWYAKMRKMFQTSVKSSGDSNYWTASGPGGDVYGTAVNVAVLAMPYGYLPLYQR